MFLGISNISVFTHRPQVHVEPSHGLIVWVVEPVLEGHRHLLPAAKVPQPHSPAEVVRVRQAGEDVDALVGESLGRRQKQSIWEVEQEGGIMNNARPISLL